MQVPRANVPDLTPNQIAFVQKNKIPPSPAPISEVGFIGWLKQNLFSSWFNTLLTLISIAIDV